MKKVFYLFILILLIVFAKEAQAGFFDNWFNAYRRTTTTKSMVPNVDIELKTNVNSGRYCFSKEMTIGSEVVEVKNLQQFLYDKGLYKEGKITGYFGALTRKAVINFQNANFNDILKPAGLKNGTGYVGKATIKKLNELNGCNTGGGISKNVNIIPEIGLDIITTTTSPEIGLDIITTTTKAGTRYSCSLGKCIENIRGAFLTSNCNGFCDGSVKRYDCNALGKCISNDSGSYINSNCDDECKPPNRKLLDNMFYDNAKAGGVVWYLESKVGNFWPDTLAEDRLYYPRMQILDPNSVKSNLKLKAANLPRENKSGCVGSGLVKACYEGTMPKDSGFEVIDSFSKLNTYFEVIDSTAFPSDYFDNNVLVFVFSSLNEYSMNCRRIIIDFRVDRVIYNVPDSDEIYRTNDTTPYNYQLSKYDMIVVKAVSKDIVDNGNICALKCSAGLKYYFDVVSIPKKDLQKLDGGVKKINVSFESDGGQCIKY